MASALDQEALTQLVAIKQDLAALSEKLGEQLVTLDRLVTAANLRFSDQLRGGRVSVADSSNNGGSGPSNQKSVIVDVTMGNLMSSQRQREQPPN